MLTVFYEKSCYFPTTLMYIVMSASGLRVNAEQRRQRMEQNPEKMNHGLFLR